MTPPFVKQLLGWRAPGIANIADSKEPTSRAIAEMLLKLLRVRRRSTESPQTLGTSFEAALRSDLALQLPGRDVGIEWRIERGRPISSYRQYAHLARLQGLLDADATLRAEVGVDYVIKPDVTIAIAADDDAAPHLHAVVSTKFTIRSDRVQNIRQEALVLIRHRRGRLPHIVVATLEPLPTRILSIARGTGEVDCVYHLALDELRAATQRVGTRKQQDALVEAVTQERLRSYEHLLRDLAAR